MIGEKQQIGRLALRHEGEWWNAYYALNDSMDGAILLGSIRMKAVVENKQLKEMFMKAMRIFVSDMLQENLGTRPDWQEPITAPEHERSGHG